MNEHFLTMFSCIGEFFNDSGRFLIGDPMANTLFTEYLAAEHIGGYSEIDVEKYRMTFDDCLPGRYMVCYELEKGNPKSFLVIHRDFFDQADNLGAFTKVKSLFFSFSHVAAVVEQEYAQDARYSMYELEPTAMYNAEDLLRILPMSCYPLYVKRMVNRYLTDCVRQGIYASGNSLAELTKGEYNWEGYRSKEVHSTHWACDVNERAREGACIIPHGVAVPSGYSSGHAISVLRLPDDNCGPADMAKSDSDEEAPIFAIRVSLE